MKKEYLLQQLMENVKKMRQHQKQFFKQKDKFNLQYSKEYEKKVDDLLKMLEEVEHKQ